MQNVLILVSCASVWQTEARLTILWRNCSFKLRYEMVSCASVWQTEARLSHLDVFGGFLMGWNRLKQYGCASAQTIVFFMEGAPSTLHTILSGRGYSILLLFSYITTSFNHSKIKKSIKKQLSCTLIYWLKFLNLCECWYWHWCLCLSLCHVYVYVLSMKIYVALLRITRQRHATWRFRFSFKIIKRYNSNKNSNVNYELNYELKIIKSKLKSYPWIKNWNNSILIKNEKIKIINKKWKVHKN